MKSLVDKLIERKHTVTVLTGTPNRYSSLKNENNLEKVSETIVRIPTMKQSTNLFMRSLCFGDFFIKGYRKAKKLSKEADVIVATTPQLLVAYLGALVKRKNKPLILDVRDLWPDVMIEMGITTEKKPSYKLLKRIEKKCYKKADEIVINSPAFESHIKKYTDKKINLITNGIDDYLYKSLSTAEISKSYNPYTITYAGNLGLAQQIDILADVAKEFHGKFKFKVIGDGSGEKFFQEKITGKGIKNIEIKEPVPRKDLIEYYKDTDAFFVHLKDIEMFKKTIPSKIFEYIATGKPVIYGLKGVAHDIMMDLQGDIYSFQASDSESLKKALYELYNNLEAKTPKNEKGQKRLETLYLRSKLSTKFSQIIEGIK